VSPEHGQRILSTGFVADLVLLQRVCGCVCACASLLHSLSLSLSLRRLSSRGAAAAVVFVSGSLVPATPPERCCCEVRGPSLPARPLPPCHLPSFRFIITCLLSSLLSRPCVYGCQACYASMSCCSKHTVFPLSIHAISRSFPKNLNIMEKLLFFHDSIQKVKLS